MAAARAQPQSVSGGSVTTTFRLSLRDTIPASALDSSRMGKAGSAYSSITRTIRNVAVVPVESAYDAG